MFYVRRANPIPSHVTFTFEHFCKVGYLQDKRFLIYGIFFWKIVYKIIILIEKWAIRGVPLIIIC